VNYITATLEEGVPLPLVVPRPSTLSEVARFVISSGTMRPGPILLAPVVFLLCACGGDGRPIADGGLPGRDSGSDGGGSDSDGGGVSCGGSICDPGEICCTDCEGVQSCADACPGLACLDGGVPCGDMVCTGGDTCCMGCDGTYSCAPDCPHEECTDGGLPDGSCRSDTDCAGGSEYCAQPDAPPACGVGCSADRTCVSSGDCPGAAVCEEYLGPCCRPGDPLSTRCVPPCDESGCGAGERCRPDGLCEPVPCSDGHECPAHTECTGAGDAHGCARDSCGTGADCDPGGYCVLGSCYAEPGSCELPAA